MPEPLMGAEAVKAWYTPGKIEPVEGLEKFFANVEVAEITEEIRREDALYTQQQAIAEAVRFVGDLLCSKNTSYGGAAFRDVRISGKTITAEDAILVRMSDKIRRLTDGEEYRSEDTILDLVGYGILLRALKIYRESK